MKYNYKIIPEFNANGSSKSCKYKKDGTEVYSLICQRCKYFKGRDQSDKNGLYIKCSYEFESKTYLKNKSKKDKNLKNKGEK